MVRDTTNVKIGMTEVALKKSTKCMEENRLPRIMWAQIMQVKKSELLNLEE